MAIGFRIQTRDRKVSPEVIEGFRGLPTANISDSMSRMFAGGPVLRPMHAGGQLLGAAVTVRTRPGDNLMVHKALDIAGPGDVIVVDAGGDTTNAIIGELMISYAKTRKIAGIIVYGAIRDSGKIAADSFPVFACGITHRGPYKDGPGEINTEISLAGMVIRPGDLIVGDDDGVVCVHYEDAAQIGAASQDKKTAEELTLKNILAGKQDKSWVDAALIRLGCTMPNATLGTEK